MDSTHSHTATQKIKCPNCSHQFLLDEALSKEIESNLRGSLQKEFDQKNASLTQKYAETKKLEEQLVEKEKSLNEQVQAKLEQEKKQLWVIAQRKAEENNQTKMQALQTELEEKTKKQRELEQKELDFLKKMRDLEDQKKGLELQYEKKFFEQSKEIEEQAKLKVQEELDLKLKQKDMQMEQLRKALEEAKRKTEQGSMQVQGDTLENDLKEILTLQFPIDKIEDVPTGIKGADIVQVVRSEFGQEAGVILWESKNTKSWNDEWIRKLKEDQAEAKADISILITKTLPNDVKDATNIEGVWVVEYKYALLIANVLRSNLLNLAKLKQSLVGKDEKMEMLHRYLTGNQFKNRIENIVLAFSSMQQDLDREKRLFQKQWAKREKEIERVVTNTTGLYGDLQGMVGQEALVVPMLELEDGFEEDL